MASILDSMGYRRFTNGPKHEVGGKLHGVEKYEGSTGGTGLRLQLGHNEAEYSQPVNFKAKAIRDVK